MKHARGTTKIKGAPKRVVILTNEGTEALIAMGLKTVGAFKSWTGNPWYDHIKDKMKGVKVVGTEDQVNLEAIAALHPDLIIGNKMRQEKIYDTSQDKDDFAAQHLTKESIPQMDGDVIFYFSYKTGDGKATQAEKEWTNDPLWKNLKAEKAFKVDDAIWNTAGGVLAATACLTICDMIC